ncbi:MAG: alpha/beta hydrolase [Halioglobus sp.]|nr:alpha/beta hydrolase [Halioglobus sp.]
MLITLLIVLSLITAWLYSWTFTKHGRIEFLPALICRAATLASRFGDPITYSDSDRANANASTTKLLQLPPTPAVQVDEDTLGLPGRTLKLRWYQHADKVDCPLVLNIHGGAWWMGNDFIDDAVMRHLCQQSGALILSVDYRLSPEHIFPAALDDCYAALLHLVEKAPARGGDTNRIILHGTSAGGALAAGVSLLCRERNGPLLALQALIVPVTDLTGLRSGDSLQRFANGYVLTASDLADMIANYLPEKTRRADPLASPIYSEHLERMPPTFIATAEFDPLRDQGEAFGKALEQAGIPVTQKRYSRTIHGFFGSKKMLRECIADTATAITAPR